MQQPTAVNVPSVVVVPPQNACCSVPVNTSTHVKGTRGTTIAIVVVHVVALLALGWWLWSTWLASLIAWIMGGILLCQFNKCTYIVAGSLYIVGAIFDLVSMGTWIAIAQHVNDSTYYDDDDDWSSGVGWFALPSALGAISFIIGAVYAFLAICNWDKSGAPDAMGPGMAGGPQVVSVSHGAPTTKHEPQAPPYGGPPPPPAYSGNV